MSHPNAINISDFQCLQDQIVKLRTENYELSEKNKKQSNDFETAKSRIAKLQQQLEEQERDFQVTSLTLRQEIDTIVKEKDDDYKPKFKKLSLYTKELQSKYEKTLEKVSNLEQKCNDLEIENKNLADSISTVKLQFDKLQDEYPITIEKLKNDHKEEVKSLQQDYFEEITNLKEKCSDLGKENSQLKNEIKTFDDKTSAQIEERKIQEKKGIRLVKELKRQLIVEKGRAEMFQKRLQELLSSSVSVSGDVDASISENNVPNNVTDTSSVGSWSFMPGRNHNVTNLTESVSLYSIESEDRETVQISTDNLSEPSSSRRPSNYSSKQGSPLSATINATVPNPTSDPPQQTKSSTIAGSAMLLEDQATLVDRVTRLQQEKWVLEEKLNYLEMSNLSLSEELSKKSELIKHYCMDHGRTKAPTSVPGNHMLSTSSDPDKPSIKSFTASQNIKHSNSNNININMDKLSVKKVVEFIKDRSVNVNDLDNLRETTRRMQLLLEETLTKNLHLQNNLDFVSAELEEIKTKVLRQQSTPIKTVDI